jgi:hypothetical protein
MPTNRKPIFCLLLFLYVWVSHTLRRPPTNNRHIFLSRWARSPPQDWDPVDMKNTCYVITWKSNFLLEDSIYPNLT